MEHQTNPEYTIACPSDIIATKLWLYDGTVAVNGGYTDAQNGGVIMIIKELTAFGISSSSSSKWE